MLRRRSLDRTDSSPSGGWRRATHCIGQRWYSLRLQLAFQLVEEAPVGVFGQDLLRTRFNHPCLAQTQRIEPDRIRGIIFAPLVVRILLQRLKRIYVARCEAALDQPPRCL